LTAATLIFGSLENRDPSGLPFADSRDGRILFSGAGPIVEEDFEIESAAAVASGS